MNSNPNLQPFLYVAPSLWWVGCSSIPQRAPQMTHLFSASVALGSNTLAQQPQSVMVLAINMPEWSWTKPQSECHCSVVYNSRDHFVYAPSQWETTLQCNVVSHWLGHTKNNPRKSQLLTTAIPKLTDDSAPHHHIIQLSHIIPDIFHYTHNTSHSLITMVRYRLCILWVQGLIYHRAMCHISCSSLYWILFSFLSKLYQNMYHTFMPCHS